MPVDAQHYKNILAQWPSGVTIVTTIKDGKWKGITASSFTSVSADPPLILICVAQKLYTHQLISESGVFAVSILNDSQAEIGKLFAGMYPDIENRFATATWHTAVTGAPILAESAGWVDCKIVLKMSAGDHTIFVGEVQDGDVPGTAAPLLYHNRRWGQFAALERTP